MSAAAKLSERRALWCNESVVVWLRAARISRGGDVTMRATLVAGDAADSSDGPAALRPAISKCAQSALRVSALAVTCMACRRSFIYYSSITDSLTAFSLAR